MRLGKDQEQEAGNEAGQDRGQEPENEAGQGPGTGTWE